MYETILRKVNTNPFSDVIYTVTHLPSNTVVNVANLRHDDFGNPVGMFTAARKELKKLGVKPKKGDKYTWYKTSHSSCVPTTSKEKTTLS